MPWIDALKYLSVAAAFLAVYLLLNGLFTNGLRGQGDRFFIRLFPNFGKSGSRAKTRKAPIRPQQSRKKVIAALAGMLLGLLITGMDVFSATTWFVVVGFTLAGYLAPGLLDAVVAAQRRRAMDLQLPDALELIANSLRAGLSLVQALEVVSKEAPAPIRDVFHEVHRDCRLGLSPEDALEKCLKQWPNRDLELFIVAAGVSMRTGGNLAEVIGRIVGTVRERFRLKGRIESLTAQGKLSGWVVGLLPVVLLIALSLLDPGLMRGFFSHPLGMAMLAGGVVMELIGAFVIRKMTQIDM